MLLIKDGVIVLEEVETEDVHRYRRMMHELQVALLIVRLNKIATTRHEEVLSLDSVLEVGELVVHRTSADGHNTELAFDIKVIFKLLD